MNQAVTKPAFGNPDEIDARLAAAEAEGRISLKPISANLGVEVEGVDLKRELSAEQVAAVYDALLRQIDASPDEVLMVGDDLVNDVRGAEVAGMRAVLIDRREGRSNASDVTTVNSLLQLESVLS